MATTTYPVSPITTRSTYGTASTDRIVLSGSGTSQWDMKYQGVSICTDGNAMWGYNLGVFEYYPDTESAAAAILAQLYSEGVRIIRLVGFNRTFGAPTKASGDSNRVYKVSNGAEIGTSADGFYNQKHPRHWEKLKMYARLAAKQGIWSVICMEGDIKQSGTQDTAWNGTVFDDTTGTYDRALTLSTRYGESIPGGYADWGLVGGYNVFTSKRMFAQVREEAVRLAREFRDYKMIFAYEFLSEPLPPSGTITTALNGRTLGAGSKYYIYPGLANDGVYGPSWSIRAGNANAAALAFVGGTSLGPDNKGAGSGLMSIEEFYRILINDVRAIDDNTPFIIGGRGGYNMSPEGDEIIAALRDTTGLGGDLVAQNKLIFTWDRLGSGTNQAAKSTGNWYAATKLKIPLFMNQLGQRVGSDGQKDPGDPNTYCLRTSVRVSKQYGVPGTIWDRRGNGANGYGTEAKNTAPDVYGNGGSMTMNTTRQNDLAQAFGERLSTLEAAAIAAATAENACLVYVKPDLSNVVKTGSSVPYSLTSITPVVDGSGFSGTFFAAAGTNAIKLDYPLRDAAGSYLPDLRLSMIFDGTNYLTGQNGSGALTFFGSPGNTSSASFTGDENMTVIVAGMPQRDGTQCTFLTLTNSGGTEKYPQIQFPAKTPQMKWQGSTGGAITLAGGGINNTQTDAFQPGVPMVIMARKSGTHPSTALTMWVNGIDDTGTGNAGTGTGEGYAGTANTLTGQTVNPSTTNVTRLRIGGPNNNGDFIGPIAGFCLARQAMSDANAHAIGRFLAYLMGGGYKA